MKKVILYIHGKGGHYTEAQAYQKNCEGFDIVGVDYDEYFPWSVESKIQNEFNQLKEKYDSITLIANSIGAYFAMHSLQSCEIEKALFISPVLDMEKLICDMMMWAHVSEEELALKGEISTDFKETLSWEYLSFVRSHPIKWNIPTEILYGEKDNLISRDMVDDFMKNHDGRLTIMKNGEHWFHTEEQIAFLDEWMRKAIHS